MISHGYDGPMENPLNRREAMELTIALGAAHRGDDYTNADCIGRILFAGSGGGYLRTQCEDNPEVYAEKVAQQIADLQTIIEPYVGRFVCGKHEQLGVAQGEEWELWGRATTDPSRVLHTSGIILGIADVVFDRTMRFAYDRPYDLDTAKEYTWNGKDFKIGVLLDTTFATDAFCFHLPAPETDRMLIPVRGFPRYYESFNGLWSWQLSGVDASYIAAMEADVANES